MAAAAAVAAVVMETVAVDAVVIVVTLQSSRVVATGPVAVVFVALVVFDVRWRFVLYAVAITEAHRQSSVLEFWNPVTITIINFSNCSH